MIFHPWMVWLAIILIMIVAEIMTVGFFSITIAVGGIFALVTSLITDLIWVQVAIFLIASIAFFFKLKPFMEKLFPIKTPANTAVDRLIGEKGIVIEDINNTLSTGQVKVQGEVWSASSYNNEVITKGSEIEVVVIKGVKTIVRKY
jgi:membrane protein implicated in regulation of membrane protease activity